MRPRIRTAIAAGFVVSSLASVALGSGFELPENGSIAMGRAGAFVARASDPSALMNNVAGIVGLPGVQVTLSSNFFVLGHCFQRAGSYQGFDAGASVDRTGTVFQNSPYDNGMTRYPQVCNRPGLFPAPQILVTWRPNRYMAFGVGVYGPNAVGRMTYDDRVNEGNPMTIAPSPIRYMLLRSDLLLLHPTLAAAFAPVHWFRVGIAIQPSIAHFSFTTMANAISGGAQSPDQDVQTTLNATGFFMAGSLGLQIVPLSFLSFGAHVHLNMQPSAAGEGTAIYAPYASNPMAMRTSTFTVDQMRASLPQQFRVGVRFNLPRALHVTQNEASPNQPYDPMRDDWFDVELDAIYETSSAFQALNLVNSGRIDVGGGPVVAPPSPLAVPHNWNNVWGLRLGGDVNVIPSRLALRTGVVYESGASSYQYAHIDFPAYDLVGIHAGASIRVGFLTISLAYAHGFFGGRDNTMANPGNAMDGAGALPTIGTMGAVTARDCMTSGSDACAVNRGVYSAYSNAFNVGLNGRW